MAGRKRQSGAVEGDAAVVVRRPLSFQLGGGGVVAGEVDPQAIDIRAGRSGGAGAEADPARGVFVGEPRRTGDPADGEGRAGGHAFRRLDQFVVRVFFIIAQGLAGGIDAGIEYAGHAGEHGHDAGRADRFSERIGDRHGILSGIRHLRVFDRQDSGGLAGQGRAVFPPLVGQGRAAIGQHVEGKGISLQRDRRRRRAQNDRRLWRAHSPRRPQREARNVQAGGAGIGIVDHEIQRVDRAAERAMHAGAQCQRREGVEAPRAGESAHRAIDEDGRKAVVTGEAQFDQDTGRVVTREIESHPIRVVTAGGRERVELRADPLGRAFGVGDPRAFDDRPREGILQDRFFQAAVGVDDQPVMRIDVAVFQQLAVIIDAGGIGARHRFDNIHPDGITGHRAGGIGDHQRVFPRFFGLADQVEKAENLSRHVRAIFLPLVAERFGAIGHHGDGNRHALKGRRQRRWLLADGRWFVFHLDEADQFHPQAGGAGRIPGIVDHELQRVFPGDELHEFIGVGRDEKFGESIKLVNSGMHGDAIEHDSEPLIVGGPFAFDASGGGIEAGEVERGGVGVLAGRGIRVGRGRDPPRERPVRDPRPGRRQRPHLEQRDRVRSGQAGVRADGERVMRIDDAVGRQQRAGGIDSGIVEPGNGRGGQQAGPAQKGQSDATDA